MARGNEIIVSAHPMGKFEEGIITDTSLPGMFMEMVPATAFVGGRPSFRARSQSDGALGPICILRGDELQGKLSVGAKQSDVTSGGVTVKGNLAVGDAYVAGTRCFVYWPVAGEDLNAILGDVAGTGDTVTQGDLFGISSTGFLKADSSYTSAPFQAMETLAGAVTGRTVVWVKYLGQKAG
jgi:hypothetical protein